MTKQNSKSGSLSNCDVATPLRRLPQQEDRDDSASACASHYHYTFVRKPRSPLLDLCLFCAVTSRPYCSAKKSKNNKVPITICMPCHQFPEGVQPETWTYTKDILVACAGILTRPHIFKDMFWATTNPSLEFG